ncbi:hypothetical protein FRX31_006132 [Thalictrum thalictroides]|uniref:Uncharacterized protein n=1 Tax=Thalictrum thalictroides TaxID=46969 RepID=A0A7J6X3I1_THATH|nr:hypothetical protein FRX31_006132 [Thalictrum thalictroides]
MQSLPFQVFMHLESSEYSCGRSEAPAPPGRGQLTTDVALDTFSVSVILISHCDSFSVGALKAYLAEFIATLLFVFACVGPAIAFSKLF